ncbi:MAG: hypothetical protein IT371_14785 [Deltaproteobacteria bacterium]|nr:hypothetical protein [Deltaproteobacteria bacterium]
MADLSADELVALLERVFAPTSEERRLAVLVDLPDEELPDTPAWSERRRTAKGWVEALATSPYEAELFVYPHAPANNADLPPALFSLGEGALPNDASEVDPRAARPLVEVLSAFPLVLAPTQLSATAPLKLLALRHGFRAATMPGFSAAMLPALRLDYAEVHRRVLRLKALLDRATSAELDFDVTGFGPRALTLDLRHRTAHASSGLLHRRGTAGNLPSGEAFIVPYEGERAGDPSLSRGELPVELGDSLLLYRIEENRARAVEGSGPARESEAARLVAEPAYGNLAELGLGVLADFGLRPTGDLLLDEKLGLHLAFGRSDHFGGRVGPQDFSRPEAVVHLDRVYLPELQPRVKVRALDLLLEDDDRRLPLMRDGRYLDLFD